MLCAGCLGHVPSRRKSTTSWCNRDLEHIPKRLVKAYKQDGGGICRELLRGGYSQKTWPGGLTKKKDPGWRQDDQNCRIWYNDRPVVSYGGTQSYAQVLLGGTETTVYRTVGQALDPKLKKRQYTTRDNYFGFKSRFMNWTRAGCLRVKICLHFFISSRCKFHFIS